MKSLSSTAYKFVTAFVIVMLALGAMPVSPAFAADTGLSAPTGNVNGAAPNNNWTNPQDGYTSNNVRATAANGGRVVQYTTFNIAAIPAGSVINGIEVILEASTSGRQVDVDLSWNNGATYTATVLTSASGGTEGLTTLGGPANTWGRTWAVGDFTNANFRVRLNTTGGGGTYSLDQIQVRVTYTIPVPTTTVGDGTSPANKTVRGSEINQAVSAFTLSTNMGVDTVANLVVTGTNTANVAANGVRIYRDNGGTANEWDGTDTLVGTASFVGLIATFTGINLPVTTTSTQYIITYDIIAAPTNGQTLTARVSSATATNVITNNDAIDATLTIDTVAPTVTNVDSTTPNPATFNVGDTITIRVTFNEIVNVTGTPQITLETGTVDRTVNFTGGNGTTQITFTYIVQAGDTSADLDYVANSLALNGGTIRDAALNNAVLTLAAPGGAGSLSANEAIAIDGIVPTVTINQAVGQADPSATQPINFTVVFSEPIFNFTNNDIVLTGTSGTGASGNFAGTTRTITNTGPNTYNVAISGLTVTGTVTASINANAVNDAANNGNTASTSTDNTVTLTGFTITASAGTGGTITPNGVINVVGGASQAFESVPSATYILSNVLVDGFSIGRINNYTINNVSSNRTIAASFDGGWSAPTGTPTNNCGGALNLGYVSDNNYVTCDNGQSEVYSNFGLNIPAGSTINYVEVAIEGHTDGRNLNVSLSENGGFNFINTLTTTFAPEPAAPDKTMLVGNRPGDDWGILFTPDSFSNTNFRVQVTGTGGGSQFSLDQLQVKVNYTPPALTATINQAVGQVDPTNASPINFTVVFNYPVSDFVTGDVALSGTAGATTATVTGSGTTYNVAVSGMTSNGTVIASLLPGVATNVNGTLNSASTSTDHTVIYDATPPTATIDLQDTSDTGISITDDLTNAAAPVFDVTFNEDVSAPVFGNFSNSGTATGCTFAVGAPTGTTYPVTVSACSEGTLILSLAAGSVTDTAGSSNAQTDGTTVTIDRTGPGVNIEQAVGQADPTGASPINFTAVFSEATYGFIGLDVTLSGTANPTVANVTGGPVTYTVAVSNMTTSGPTNTVIASIGAGVATDAAGNGNLPSSSVDNTVIYNSNAPIVAIDLQLASDSGILNTDNITNVASPIFNVAFDEAVSGLTNTDFSNAGGTAAGCTFAVGAPTGNSYPVTVSGCSEGTLILRIAGGAVTNIAAVANAQTTGPTVTIDRTGPTVAINQAVGQTDPTNLSPIEFTAIFNETVTNFATGDVVITGTSGATTGVVTGSGTTYNVAVSDMANDGTVIAAINAGVATDAAGNSSAANTTTDNTVTYDTTAPTVTINQAGGQIDPTNASPINFTVVFSETVTGFATGDVTLSGTAGAINAVVTGSGTTYNVAVSGMAGSGTVIADIAASVAVDASGNDNAASTSSDHTVTYDVTRPTVTVDQAVGQADPTNLSPIHFTVEFSKPVTGFVSTDVTLSSGTATVTPVSATIYDVSVSGMAQGNLVATIAAGVAVDGVGNTNVASTSADNVVLYDTIAPTVTINQAVGQADPANASPIHFTAVFSEPVSGFTGAGVTLSSGTATVTPVSGTVYDISVTGMAQGVLTASIPAGSAADDVGIVNIASTSTDNSVLYDTVIPTVTVNKEITQPDPTNTGPINFTVIFSEPVTGFTNVDLVWGGTAAPSTAVVTTGSGTTYNVAVSGMAADGTVTLTVPAGGAQDATGNGNAASTSTDNSVLYDTTRPTVTINQAAAQLDPTNASPINFTVVFSEPVTGFTDTDITLTGTAGPTTAVVTGSGATYNVAVSGMTGNGTVTAFVLVNAGQDAANNSSFASTSADNTVTYDIGAPTVTIEQSASQADPTGVSPIDFTVVFSESMNSASFTGADITLSGTANPTTAVVTGSGTTFTVSVSGMTGSGTVIATIPAGGVLDLAGNGNAASVSVDNTVTYDVTLPTVTVNQAVGQADPTNGSPINFTVIFSEPMTGFTNTDVTLAGTAVPTTAVVTGGGTTYNVAVSGMSGSGTVIVSVPAGGAADISGNLNAASTSTDNTVTYDVTRPTVTIEQDGAQVDPTGISPINFAVVFSEPVSGFANTDVTLSGTAGATTVVVSGGGAVYNVAVSGMTGSGTVIAVVNAGGAVDVANNTNFASTSTDNTVTYDNAVPSVTINQAVGQADPTNVGPINFTVIFSKTVTGFTNTDVTLTGTATGTLTTVVTGSGTTYNVAVSGMTGSGTVIASIPAGGAVDTAGNGNTNSTSTDNVVTFDVTAPTVTINQAVGQADPTNASPIDFTVVFSEAVTGFANADVTLSGTAGAITASVTGSGTTYNVAVSGMTGSGTVIVTIPATVAVDAAGNNNAASSSTDNSVTYDNVIPSVTINQAAGQVDPTNGSPINFTVVFSKPVTGFIGTDVSLAGTAGATTAVVTGTGTTYNVAVSGMANSGTVTATIPANVAVDASSNPNLASSSADNTVTYDIAIPAVTINRAVGQADPTNTSPINFTVVFSEPVTGFTNAGVALSGTAGATTAVVTGTGATYNVAVSGMTGPGTVIATVAAGNAQDAAGNSNANSTSTDNNVQYDATAPTVTINQGAAQADPTNVSPIIFDVVFSKSVTGFTGTDITLGGTAGATTAVVTGSGTTYSVAVNGMTLDGTVTATIAAGAAVDTFGNSNAASTSTDNTVLYGITAPTVTIDQAVGQADPTNTSPINFVVVFSKPVTGFTNADVSLSGTAGATTVVVTGSGANYNVAVSGMTLPGTVIATIPAGAALDATLNGNTASTSTDNNVLYDVTAPTVTINQAAGQVDPSNTSPINFTVVFNESVTGFAGADVALTGTAGATTAVVTGSGTTYNVAVSGMTASGTVIATIPAGNAQDVAGNGNANSTSTDNSVTFDFTAPSVTINQAAGQTDPTNTSPIIFDVLFSKPVTGFANADVTLGGTAGATTVVVAGAGTTYTVTVTGMTSNGTVIASIPAGVATDSVGNTNTGSTSTDNTVTYDTVGPTVTINQAVAQVDPTGASPINFTVVFSEPVTGFTNAALNVAGTAGPTTAVVTGSGATYNVAISGMSVTGTVFVTIADSAGTDAAGNPSVASTSTDNTVTYDTGAPTVTINQAVAQVDPTNVSPINFTVVFNKPVTGFTNADVVLTGTAGATTAVVTGTGATYNVEASGMSGSGTVIASIPAGRVVDSANNGNIASTSTDNTVTYDISAPTATINQAAAQADPTNSSPVNFTVEFNEPVFGFTSNDITLGGTAGATTAVVSGSGTTYNVAVGGMVTDGTVTAALGAAVVTDVTGNSNVAATSTDNEVTYNTTNPTILVEKAAGQADPTNLPTIDFTVTFSELVVGFTNTDVVLGGTAGANNVVITGAGPVYTVTVSGMTNDGTVTVSVPAGAVTDPSSNPNPASTAVTVTYLDGVGPSVQLVNTTPETVDHVLSSPETVTFDITQFKVQFNQPVFDPQGDSDAEDVTNPNNYMLIRDLGDTGGLQTVSCVAGAVVPADTQIAIGTVTYDSLTYTATFTVNSGLPLSNGDYHLFVCGTTSIVDPLNNALALVGSSGQGGTDYRHSFTVSISGNGGGGGGGSNEDNGGNGSSSTTKSPLAASGFLIPVTGFSPNEVTMLPVQPEDKAYSSMDKITIEIPSLGIKFPIVGVSVTDNGWNLTWLKDNVGYLESSAYPTFNGNTVLTAHVRDANKNLGPFSDIKGLQLGDKILLHAYGKVYVYEVQENTKISPRDIEAAFKHEEYSWVTLVTCEDYNAKIEEYYHRRMVRAVLISVIPER